MYEKKTKSLPLITLEPKDEEKLPHNISAILEEMSIPGELLSIAESEAMPQVYKDGVKWHLDYKKWRIICNERPPDFDIQTWVKIIDNDDMSGETLDSVAKRNADGRTLCICGEYGSCVAVRLVRRL